MSNKRELDKIEKKLHDLWLESRELEKTKEIVDGALYFAGRAIAIAKNQNKELDNLNIILDKLYKKEEPKCQEQK